MAAQVPRTARNKFKSVFRRDMCALQRGFSCPLRGNSPSGRKLFARSGNRRSAASGGNSKSVSRKRHDWRACEGAGIVVPQRCKAELSAFSGQPRHRTQRNLLKKWLCHFFDYKISISTGITTKHAIVESAAPCAANSSSAPYSAAATTVCVTTGIAVSTMSTS